MAIIRHAEKGEWGGVGRGLTSSFGGDRTEGA